MNIKNKLLPLLNVSGWTTGAHIISVVVIDYDGNTAVDTINITK